MLPPIAVVTAATREAQHDSGDGEAENKHESDEQLSPGEIRVHFTPDNINHTKYGESSKSKNFFWRVGGGFNQAFGESEDKPLSRRRLTGTDLKYED